MTILNPFGRTTKKKKKRKAPGEDLTSNLRAEQKAADRARAAKRVTPVRNRKLTPSAVVHERVRAERLLKEEELRRRLTGFRTLHDIGRKQ